MAGVTKRRERIKQFEDHGSPGGMSFSQELVGSAISLLRIALEQRKQPVSRCHDNHYTSHAPGAIVLAVTAFDVWVREFEVGLEAVDSSFPKCKKVDNPICRRYADLLRNLGESNCPFEADLRSVVDVRDEIVHYLPRTLPGRTLPAWIDSLDRRGLLIRSPTNDADFTLSQKLSSYALAHWACTTLASCVATLIGAVRNEFVPFVGGCTAKNFSLFSTITAPGDLVDFDGGMVSE